MIFKPYNCDFGIKLNGQNYDFDQIDSMVIEDPEQNVLTRGSNAKNKVGLAYKQGLKEPKTITVTIVGMSKSIADLLMAAWEAQTRMDVFCVDGGDGSSRIGKNCILRDRPRQLTIDESAESMNVALAFQTFEIQDDQKSE